MGKSGWRRFINQKFAAALVVTVFLWMVVSAPIVLAAPAEPLASPSASCGQLAAVDPSGSNGSQWGATLLAGFNVRQGWFGVPVCANYINLAAPGGANVSCTRMPRDMAASGCAPGSATYDGFGLSFQCVELVARFAKWAFNDTPGAWRGDAPFLWLAGNHPSDFSAIPNGAERAPTPGDVLVWGSLDSQRNPWPAGPAGGHVAVVASVGPNTLTFVEQNMLIHAHGVAVNIPSETTTLTQNTPGHWTIGRTYALNGGRTLYGWLHSSHNTGHFPSTGSALRSLTPTPTQAAPMMPATPTPIPIVTAPAPKPLPALTQAVFVTGNGALAQLVWSSTHTPLPPDSNVSADAHAVAESLGEPPGTALAPDQTPAVVTLPTQERYMFVRGADGLLYAAYTTPTRATTFWQALGAPAQAKVSGSVSAVWDSAGMAVAVVGSDGAVWTRSGPAGFLGVWTSLGIPTSAPIQGRVALMEAPGGSASSTIARIVLVTGHDGALYEARWTATASQASANANAAGWTTWSAASVTGATALLSGDLRVVSEPTTSGGALDALSTDGAGRLWLLRRAATDQPWTAHSIAVRDPGVRTLAVATEAPLTGGVSDQLQVYLVNRSGAVSYATLPADAQSSTIQWQSLGGSLSPATSQPVALALDSVGGALIQAPQSNVTVAGPAAEIQVLAPSASTTGSAAVGAVGVVRSSGSFTDAFSGAELDPRWTVLDVAPSSITETQGALTLTTLAADGRGAIAQAAPTSAFSVTTLVTPDASWSTAAHAQSPATAGIELELNDWNRLTLGIQSNGAVTLCPTVDSVAQACGSAAAPSAANAGQARYLRIRQDGAMFVGEVSVDGSHWSTVGSWSPAWLATTVGSLPGPFAPPMAPMAKARAGDSGFSRGEAIPVAFTSVQLFVSQGLPTTAGSSTGGVGQPLSARFSQFTFQQSAASTP